uniref:Putative secreted protein n=1 Tax=Ixodes ricinus TaxID=34613 RepID=A0A6B0UI90_IXORI
MSGGGASLSARLSGVACLKLEPPLATAAPPVAEEPVEPSSLGRLLPLEPAGEDARDELLDSSRDGLELPSPLPEAPSTAACADARSGCFAKITTGLICC